MLRKEAFSYGVDIVSSSCSIMISLLGYTELALVIWSSMAIRRSSIEAFIRAIATLEGGASTQVSEEADGTTAFCALEHMPG